MNKETFIYLDGHTEYHEVDDNAVYHHVLMTIVLTIVLMLMMLHLNGIIILGCKLQIMLKLKKSLLMQSLVT